MKDVFKDKYVAEFVALGAEFIRSLRDMFPDCPETRDWLLWYENIVGDDAARRSDAVDKWVAGTKTPLAKGTARYMKAVQSLTGKPTCVYHAIAYHDADAVHANHDALRALHLPAKLEGMSDRDRAVFWDYMEGMNRHAYSAAREPPPSVPTVQEIADNIERRRRGEDVLPAVGKTPDPTDGSVLHTGIRELWARFAACRNVAVDAVADDELLAVLQAPAVPGMAPETTLNAACLARAPEAQAFLCERLPAVGADPLTEDQWVLYEKLTSMASMQTAFPPNMLRGIEDAASDLVAKLEDGSTTMADLDLHKIGEQVLSQMKGDDINAFAGNLDKLLPAWSALQR